MKYSNLKFKTTSILISTTFLLAILFCSTYFLTLSLFKNNTTENQSVFSNNDYLSDDIFIALKTNNLTDILEKLSNLKLKFNLSNNLTEEDLIKALSKKGYILSNKTNEKLTFTRTDIKNEFKANMYYIGEENGYICLFKTDENGNIMNSEKTVYNTSKPISMLPEVDQEYIKNNNLFFEDKTKALEQISEIIS